MAATLQAAVQKASTEFQTIETELTATVEARQRLDSQLTENEGVLKEMNLLKPHNTVYKLVGPSLVPQDPVEAKVNVEKRLGFIKSEIERVEKLLKEIEGKAGVKRQEMIKAQTELQKLQGAPKA